MNEIRISPTQLKLWASCREAHRKAYLLERESTEPNVHYHFGKVIHKMAQGYWAGEDYLKTFHTALAESQKLDPRKLDAKDQKKWTELCESIAPITTIYFGYHGDAAKMFPPRMNEKAIEWEWGTHAGLKVICNGIVDRLNHVKLIDTKTASVVGKDWKTDLKTRLLREPQMGFYHRYITEIEGCTLDGVEYEIIVKPYRGSDPRIETIDVTREVERFAPVFRQQMDWMIREICEFYAKCRDAEPWPMSSTDCITVFGECAYLPVCLGRADINDEKLYQIRKKDLVEV